VALTDDAILEIKGMILSGELGPGDRLPRENDLAERLGISRNSLREAVRALSLINVLVVRQGDGTYVTSLEPSLLMDAMSFVVDLHRNDSVLQFLEVRRSLEGTGAMLAASHMSSEAVVEARSLLGTVDADSSVEHFVEVDMAFHALIAAGSGNPVLEALLESLAAPLQRARVWRGLTQSVAVGQTLFEHEAILDAIDAHDGELARARAIAHVAGVEEWLRRSNYTD
jgi:GntR family transcriptional regulator, transcriptional repressor for pyruvate dehydrogenase complex